MAWSVVSEKSSCFPLALWLTKWWLICCSVTVLCPGSEATLHREPWAGFSLCFLSLDCECTRGSSIPTQLCAFSPWVHSGDTRGSALTCPVWVFMPCLLWGLTAALLVAPFTPAARGFKSLYLQLSGVPIHRLAVPACGLETFRGTARPPLTCASRSGGTPTPCACSDFAGPLRRLDVGIKATLCESVVLLLFAICNGLEACHSHFLG